MSDIVISEFMDQSAIDTIFAGRDVLYDPNLVDQTERLQTALANCRALVVRNRTQVRGALLDAAPQLKVVGRRQRPGAHAARRIEHRDAAARSGKRQPVAGAPGARVGAGCLDQAAIGENRAQQIAVALIDRVLDEPVQHIEMIGRGPVENL